MSFSAGPVEINDESTVPCLRLAPTNVWRTRAPVHVTGTCSVQ